MSTFMQRLRSALARQEAVDFADHELIHIYLHERKEEAFEALVRRHGPMVMGVCRRVLRNSHDAEDAFQATFLVLVRKAPTLRSPRLLGNWLYGVAYRTALEARKRSATRTANETEVARRPQTSEDLWPDLQPILDQELQRLPDKYRVVLVLCDLEGKTRKDAARHIGCPEGTVASRLASARAILAKRLRRHVPAISGETLGAMLSLNSGAGVSTSVISATTKVAGVFAAGQIAAGLGSANIAQVVALAEGVLKSMLLTKIKITTALVLAVAVSCYLGAIGVRIALGQNPNQAKIPQAEGKAQGDEGGKAKVLQLDGSNAHIAWSPDGKELVTVSFTMEMEDKTVNGQKTKVYAGNNSTLRFWDVAKGEVRLSLGEQKRVTITSLAFSPDAKTLAVGVEDRSALNVKRHEVRLIDSQTGAIRKTIPHPGTVRAIAFSPDGNVLAIGGSQISAQETGPFERMIRLWDVGKEKLLSELKQRLELNQEQVKRDEHLNGPRALAFSPDGRLLATADADHSMRLLDVPAGKLFKVLERQDGMIFALRFSPDGKLLVSGNNDGTAKVWDVSTGKLLKTLQANKDKPVWSVDFSPDGKLLVTSGPQTEAKYRDGQLVFWNTQSWEAKPIPRKVHGWIDAVAFSPDGQSLAISSTHLTGLCETIGQIDVWRVTDLMSEAK
jgi:RNA polymerase sigma factor (sigma-70 family)